MWRGATFVTQSRVYVTRGSILETKLEHAVCFVNINTTRARFFTSYLDRKRKFPNSGHVHFPENIVFCVKTQHTTPRKLVLIVDTRPYDLGLANI